MSTDKTQNLLGWTSGALSTTILSNGGPASSLSAVTFFANFNSGATIYHGVPHKPSQFVASQASLSVCLVQLLPHNAVHGNATKLFLFDHDDQQRFLESYDFEKIQPRLLQFYETKLSLQIAPLAFSVFDQFS